MAHLVPAPACMGGGHRLGQFLDFELRDDPMWVATRKALERCGQLEAGGKRALEILDAASEEPAAFRLSSRPIAATARRT